jgi:hypothetical protein
MRNVRMTRLILLTAIAALTTLPCRALDIVKDGKPAAVVVVDRESAGGKKPRRGAPTDASTAAILVDWIRKITDAELPVAPAPTEGQPAIYVGAAAVRAGLDLKGIKSPTNEGMRVKTEAGRVLIAGQCPAATLKAACRFLEELGCRYFMDGPLGEVYPEKKTLAVGEMDITDKPGFLYRSIWGSTWTGRNLWKTWNGAGGIPMNTRHAWASYIPKKEFEKHPEFFRMDSEGKRRAGEWLCSSSKDVRALFAERVSAAIAAGTTHPSISPPDGRSYCQCPKCRAQDDPDAKEPSSGYVCMTNRFVDFFDDIARRTAREHPESILSFYCYADYTQPPTKPRRLSPNLCAWIAPIRYCRFHAIGNEICPSRTQLEKMIDSWSESVSKIGWRTYNYNLAECTVPVSKIGVWTRDIPYLKRKGCVGINLETLHSWHIYGPHIYLSIRLAYSPGADAGAIMDDYYAKFFGPAAQHMKAYWTAVDRACCELQCHSGSFFGVDQLYTPALLRTCRKHLDEAAAAAGKDNRFAERVALHDRGFQNAEQYMQLRAAANTGNFAGAKKTYDRLLERNDRLVSQKLINHYTPRYVRRFLGRWVEAGTKAVAAPNRLLAVLPDRWRLAYDPDDNGLEEGFAATDFDDSKWRQVATWSATLNAQGLEDKKTIMWYRARFEVPKGASGPALFFAEVDGVATVFVNGKQVGQQPKKRYPFEVDIGTVSREGQNVAAVRVDHSRITELDLGGIVRPVLLIDKGR